jgi:hypothetical protein
LFTSGDNLEMGHEQPRHPFILLHCKNLGRSFMEPKILSDRSL